MNTQLPPSVRALGKPTAIYHKNQSGQRTSLILGVALITFSLIVAVVGVVRLATPRANDAIWFFGVAGVALLIAFGSFAHWQNKRIPARVIVTTQGLARIDGDLSRPHVRMATWDEIVGVTQDVVHRYNNAVHSGTTHLYTLFLREGGKLTLTEEFEDIDTLGKTIQQEVSNRVYPAMVQQYERGDAADFGALIVSREGITKAREQLAWELIEAVEIRNGVLLFKYKDEWERRGNIPIARIVNPYVLFALIRHASGLTVERV
jgi:hypothetical protein